MTCQQALRTASRMAHPWPFCFNSLPNHRFTWCLHVSLRLHRLHVHCRVSNVLGFWFCVFWFCFWGFVLVLLLFALRRLPLEKSHKLTCASSAERQLHLHEWRAKKCPSNVQWCSMFKTKIFHQRARNKQRWLSFCSFSGCIFTVKHLVLDSPGLAEERERSAKFVVCAVCAIFRPMLCPKRLFAGCSSPGRKNVTWTSGFSIFSIVFASG